MLKSDLRLVYTLSDLVMLMLHFYTHNLFSFFFFLTLQASYCYSYGLNFNIAIIASTSKYSVNICLLAPKNHPTCMATCPHLSLFLFLIFYFCYPFTENDTFIQKICRDTQKMKTIYSNIYRGRPK